ACNQLERAVDVLRGQWLWRYDGSGLLVEALNPLEELRRYEYSGGLLRATIGPQQERTQFEYDAHGNLASVLYPTGAQVRWRHDQRGHFIWEQDAHGAEWRWRHDVLGRPVRMEEPTGAVWERRYDAEGNLLETQGPLRRLRFSYSNYHQLAGWEEAGTRVSLGYDTEGRLTSVTNESGETFRYTRDACGRVVCEEGFDGSVRYCQYDLAGRLNRLIHPSLRTETLSHDALGRVVAVERSDGSFQRYRYRPDGALVEATNENGKVVLERDALGRVIRELQGEVEVASRYSPAGYRVEVSSSLGAHQSLTRDMLGAVQGLHHASQDGGSPWSVLFERDAAGRELARQMPGGVAARWRYDEVGRPLERRTLVAGMERGRRTWRWRDEDQVAVVQDSALGLMEFRHDDRGRLIGARLADGSFQHRVMDAVGNLFRRPDRSDRRYGRGGRLEEADGTRYAHDAEGRLVEKHEAGGRTWHYKWGDTGLLREVQRPDGARVRFGYDALSRRTSKALVRLDAQGREHVEQEVRFVWDGHVPLHEVSRTEGLTTWLFEPARLAPLAKEDSTGRYAVVTDHQGTPTEAYDELGQLAWRMQLDTFGVARTDVALTRCPWRWPGQYEDEETGLYYNRFRYYDPSTGCYLSQDPISLRGGLALFAYVPSPDVQSDPLGLAGTKSSIPGPPLDPRPPGSNQYSVWFESQLQKGVDFPGRSDGHHFAEANRQLHQAFQADSGFADAMEKQYPGIKDAVTPGPRGGILRDSPHSSLSWHHEPTRDGAIQLVPMEHHQAKGPVQASLHPNQKGGMENWGGGRKKCP
ncbi:MAG TPA: RHS repeat-associated core domain-containing protein, partial [Archangium sp.]|nr:RHS repeat-associated core domain-containing protein [Archangium sp.]